MEEGEKRKIRAAFRHYVNPEIADLIASVPSRLRLGGERRPISVLFSDIRGFTSIAERLPPETLGEMLGQYLEAMTEVVFAHGGLLDKYIGDAVMAFWGSPVPADDHAARCCRAALDMMAALDGLNQRWADAGLPRLGIRIGISSGDAIVGNFGSSRRFSYTAVGDTVNLGSRLERLNEEFGTDVLISDDTHAAIGDEFVCREVGRTAVKGQNPGDHRLRAGRPALRYTRGCLGIPLTGRTQVTTRGTAPAAAASSDRRRSCGRRSPAPRPRQPRFLDASAA